MQFTVVNQHDFNETTIHTLADELGNHWTHVSTAHGEDAITNPAGMIIELQYGGQTVDELEDAIQRALMAYYA